MDNLARVDAPNVLLAAPAFRGSASRACARLLSEDSRPPPPLIGVTFRQTPDRWLAAYAERLPELPEDVWLVCAGEHVRSATGDPIDGPQGITIRTVESPGNLTKLGVALTECIPEAADGDGPAARLCFESIGTLYQHADGRTVYQFLQVLSNHVSAHDVRAHYHVDPAAIDERDFGRLETLFDAVVRVSEGDEVAVRTR